MKRIIVAVALIATGSNVVAGPMCMAFHASNKRAATPVTASKQDTQVQEEIAKRIAAVTKGASQVEASEQKQVVSKPGYFSRTKKFIGRHSKKFAFGAAALVAAVLALDSEKCGKNEYVQKVPMIGTSFGQAKITGPISNGASSVWARMPNRPGFLKASEVKDEE